MEYFIKVADKPGEPGGVSMRIFDFDWREAEATPAGRLIKKMLQNIPSFPGVEITGDVRRPEA